MRHPDVEKVLDLVRERTGHEVTVILDPSLKALSTVRAASAAVPAHTIRVNPQHETIAGYLVAVQAAMLLLQWGPVGEVQDFASSPEKTSFVERKFRGLLAGKGTPGSPPELYARVYVDGLLRQLSSIPVSILAGDWLRRECPGLRSEQEAAVSVELRQNSTVLDPDLRQSVPDEILDRSAGMNAAFALWWAEAGGSDAAMLPYRATGYAERGRVLLDALQAIPEDAPGRFQRAIDAWAQILGMVGWYEWIRRKG